MLTPLLLVAATAFAHGSGLDRVKPAEGMTARKRTKLDCKDAASIRNFKAAVVEDSGWEHKLADEWARCACPKEADAAGWTDPRPRLPADWRGALPGMKPDDHPGNVKRLSEEFLLFHLRPLPITRLQADQIGDCWYRATRKAKGPAKKAARKKT